MDVSSPAPPAKVKGSASGHKRWRTSWCDFYPILERPRRPFVWSQSSVIWTAHPTQPLIIGLHFTSSKQFHLASPTPVLSSPASFEPPTVISVSSRDEWLFAFYPRKDGEGVGCMWNRGFQIDSWQVKEWWTFTKSGGAVSATWLAGAREWAPTPSGIPTRLPFRGPTTPVSNPTLVVVTEDNNLFVFYYRYIVPGLRSIKRSLTIPGLTVESSQTFNATDSLENANGTKHCVHAVISVGYNESSIFIATHSRRMPISPLTDERPDQFNSMGLVDLLDPNHRDIRSNDFETWGEEYTVEVLEAQLRFDGIVMSLSLQTFGTLDVGHGSLLDISFLCTPPPDSSSFIGDPATRRPPEKGHTYLAVSWTNFHSYTSLPTSSLKLYSLVQKATSTGRPSSIKKVLNQEASLAINDGVIVQTDIFVDFTSPPYILMHAYILHHSGSLPAGSSGSKDLPIGIVKVLNIPDLSDNLKFEPVTIHAGRDSTHDLPLFVATSPNHGLLCALSTSLWKTQVSIHTLPKSRRLDLISPPPLSAKLAVAILGRKSTSDIIHCVSSPKMIISEATDVIYHTLEILENFKPEFPSASIWDVMGVATEVYRSRAGFSTDTKGKQLLEDQWQTAHDICSVVACNIAFEDCKEENGYDLEAAWQLITLSTWVINFTEKVMKSAVICNNGGMGPTDPSFYSPELLHLTHPFALRNLILALKHVNTLRSYIGSLPAGGDNPQMAQRVLLDAVDSASINVGSLITLLEESLQTVVTIDSQVCQRALAACQPMGAMLPYLTSIVKPVADLLNTTTLFIKTTDFVDGMASLSTEKRKIDGNDVINKRLLQVDGPWNECLRCGGKTTVSKNVGKVVGLTAPRWVLWERMWETRCICGGPWFKGGDVALL